MNELELMRKIADSVYNSIRNYSIYNSIKNSITNSLYITVHTSTWRLKSTRLKSLHLMASSSVRNSVYNSVWRSVNQKLETYE